jgi:hypothetical protein
LEQIRYFGKFSSRKVNLLIAKVVEDLQAMALSLKLESAVSAGSAA